MMEVRMDGVRSLHNGGSAAMAVVAFLLGLGGCAATRSGSPATSGPLNATYRIEGKEVRLVSGRAERESAPGSAAMIRTSVVGKVVSGDLDRDGDEDAGLILSQDNAGSGTFFYAVAARNDGEAFAGTPAVRLGDRVVVSKTEIHKGVIVVGYLDRRPGEPMTAAPTLGMTMQLTLKGDKLSVQGPFVDHDATADAEGPLLPRISGGEWRLVRLKAEGQDRALAPEKTPTLAVEPSGKVAGMASVNRYFGNMTVDGDGHLSWGGPLGSTMMAGPQPLMDQEQAFLKALQKTDRLSLRDRRLVMEDEVGQTALEFER